MKPHLLLALALLCTGCASDNAEMLERTARDGIFPPTLAARESATALTRAFFAGGHVDSVRVGLTSYLVVFRHGSGIPVTGIAVYRSELGRWRLVAEPKPPAVEFFRAEAADGKILLRGERSRQTWVIFDPAESRRPATQP